MGGKRYAWNIYKRSRRAIFSGTDLMFHIFEQSGLKFTSDILTEFRIAERFFRRDLKFGTECFHAALTKISKRRLFFRKVEHRP